MIFLYKYNVYFVHHITFGVSKNVTASADAAPIRSGDAESCWSEDCITIVFLKDDWLKYQIYLVIQSKGEIVCTYWGDKGNKKNVWWKSFTIVVYVRNFFMWFLRFQVSSKKQGCYIHYSCNRMQCMKVEFCFIGFIWK